MRGSFSVHFEPGEETDHGERELSLEREIERLVMAPAIVFVVAAAVPLLRAVLRFQRCADGMHDRIEQVAGATWDRYSPTAKLALPDEYRKHFGSDGLLEEYYFARRSVVKLAVLMMGGAFLMTLVVAVASRFGAGAPR